jgi:hypothetical protein
MRTNQWNCGQNYFKKPCLRKAVTTSDSKNNITDVDENLYLFRYCVSDMTVSYVGYIIKKVA